MRYPAPRLTFLLLASALLAPRSPAARTSTWTDATGASFRAEPTEILGPFALYNTTATSGRRTLLRGLSPEECRRFQRETAERPALADRWSEAKGDITGELKGRVMRVTREKLVPANLSDRPEPQVVVVLFGSHNDPESWGMVHGFIPTYHRIEQVYPGRCETVFFGVREKALDHWQIARESWMPWLVTDFEEQRNLRSLSRFAPREGILMLAISRDGTPLLSSNAENVEAIKQFIDGLSDLLRAIDPENPATWRDRRHYLDAVRTEQFAHGSSAPVLVGNPLRPEGLRQRGVSRVEARLTVGVHGRVTAAAVATTGGVTAAMQAPLADALTKATIFSPAIEQGQPVAADFDYAYDAVPSGAALADVAWLRGDARIEIAIPSWLVLRPIPVPETVFSSVDHVDAQGTTVMTTYSVSTDRVNRTAQMNAFNSDFFTDPGAVAPNEGDPQVVDGEKYTWQRVKSEDGFVNLQTTLNRDYCVGYVWTELDSPRELNGWLGIGSDDGLKIWLNGELVHDRWIRRISRIDDDIVPLHLKAGKNRLLIKIQNAKGDWSFITRLRVKAPAP
jgi:hypothetical protein